VKLRVAIAADHGGFVLKNELISRLSDGYDVVDLGAHRFEAEDDYPDFAEVIARTVASGSAERGILVCGSGVGACVAANKAPGIRACLCHDTYSAHQGVEHDDMNVLCLGARVIGLELATELVAAFLSARFTGEPRHQRRLDKVLALERKASS
jgi:ribose 5-phosphate isomerase B